MNKWRWIFGLGVLLLIAAFVTYLYQLSSNNFPYIFSSLAVIAFLLSTDIKKQ